MANLLKTAIQAEKSRIANAKTSCNVSVEELEHDLHVIKSVERFIETYKLTDEDFISQILDFDEGNKKIEEAMKSFSFSVGHSHDWGQIYNLSYYAKFALNVYDSILTDSLKRRLNDVREPNIFY
tara:strand:- start:26979 stop:27353 length:375 start_codon:yes stop_codon:yes gene_type:complete